jgi:phosphoserine phosphatase RsbU/P
MIEITLKTLLEKKEVASLLQENLNKSNITVGITDVEGSILWGEISQNSSERYSIKVAKKELGYAIGSSNATSVAALLSYLATVEAEKNLAIEELEQKHEEINLFQSVSEKITGSLELSVVLESVIEEINTLIEATSGSIMLVNEEKGTLDIIAAFGTAHKVKLNPQISFRLDGSIAGSVAKSGKGEIINDVLSDSRFVAGKNPVSSLMCVPLKTRSKVLGVLNISHAQPTEYTEQQMQTLTILGAQAAQAIENAILHKNELKAAIAQNEIEKGRQMQKDFLPDQLPQIPEWELGVFFAPARQVAGDFYDTFILPNNQLGLVIADVCDKGVGSALFMALFRSLIRVFSAHIPTINSLPSEETARLEAIKAVHNQALEAVVMTNDYVAENHSNLNMFATLFFGILDPVTGLLTYVNGGHEPLLIIGSEGIKERLKPTGPAVGMMPSMTFRTNCTYIRPGELLFGYTDGVPEAHDIDGKFFTEDKLISILDQPPLKADELIEKVRANVMAHTGEADQFDDITMLALRRIVKS